MPKPRHQWGDARLVDAVKTDFDGVLYHLTDKANEESIDRHGLLSKDEAFLRRVSPIRPRGNALTRYLDDRDGLNNYVFLSFFRNILLPKEERQDRFRSPVLLEIDPEILFIKGVDLRLGRGWRAPRFPTMRAYYEMDWEIFDNPELRRDVQKRWRWNEFLSYEILVLRLVPREYILGIADRRN